MQIYLFRFISFCHQHIYFLSRYFLLLFLEMIFTFNLWPAVADGQFYLHKDLGAFLMLIWLSVFKVFLIFQ